MEIERLAPHIGAVIHGVDLAEIDDPTFDAVHKALLDHLVVFFRDQTMTREQHVAFGRRFGHVQIHPFHHRKDVPEIHPLENDERRPPAVNIWHTDVTYLTEPPMGSILYAREVPELGGDTLWANMYLAYETLSEPIREFIEPLRAVHDFMSTFGKSLLERDDGIERLRKAKEEMPPVEHPVVRTHPETGRKCLFVNSTFTTRLVGLSTRESDAVLNLLYQHVAETPELTCRFRWEPGSVAVWDNRCTQHYARADYFPQRRFMERVTIDGDRPY